MTDSSLPRSLDELTLGSALTMEDLVSRTSLAELVSGTSALFDLPVRLFGGTGTMLADVPGTTPALHNYLGTTPTGRRSVIATVEAVKTADPAEAILWLQPCPSGLRYAVTAIRYDGRRIGKAVVGPYMVPELEAPPQALLELAHDLDATKLAVHWREVRKASDATVEKLIKHLLNVLESRIL
ncbi:MAG: PocR ligand-binding domain-containing protein [Polyangiaceae bacterium]